MGDIAVDYTSTGYLDKHLGVSRKKIDATIVRAIVTRHLAIEFPNTLLSPLHSTFLFRQLRHLELDCVRIQEVLILPYLEQIERLEIALGSIPKYSLNVDLPLTHTLQWLELRYSTAIWMLGKTFKALRVFTVTYPSKDHFRHEGLYVGLPACTTLTLVDCSADYYSFFSCSNVQNVHLILYTSTLLQTSHLAAFNSLHDFLINLSCLQNLDMTVPRVLGLDSLIDFVFCGASEHGVWRDIRSVEVGVWFGTLSESEASDFIDQTVGHQRQHYEKWWKSFTVAREKSKVIVRASM